MAQKLTRVEQKENSRRLIIDESIKLFSRKGFVNTSTAEIAKATRLSHGALFIHFPTRDDLISAVIDDFGTKFSAAFSKKMTASKLEECLKAHLKILAKHEDFFFALISDAHHLPQASRGLFYMINSAISWHLYTRAKNGMDAGIIKTISQARLFTTWISLVQYTLLNRDVLSQKRPILAEKSDDLVDHFLTLISI